MANNQDNLVSLADRTTEEKRKIAIKGGKASGEARREKATMKKALEMLLNETNNKGKTYRDLATLGLIKGAINGNATNYRTIVEVLGELQAVEQTTTPTLQVEIVNNEELEGVMYEDSNRP